MGWRKQAHHRRRRWEREVSEVFRPCVTRDCRKQAPLITCSHLFYETKNIYKDLVMRSCSTLVLRPERSSDIPRCCTPPSLPACAAARSGHIEDNYVQPQVINAVAIRRQRPFRAATAGDDNLIVFHQGKCCYLVRLRTKLLNI